MLVVLLGLAPGLFAGEKEESIAVAMVEYLISARAVIAQNQKLINDAAKGDKGFTPDVYEQQVRREFLNRTSYDIANLASDDFGRALSHIHQSARQVVAEAQPRINELGKEFKGFNPAAFGARVGALLQQRSAIRIKQTSVHFRGAYNRPDEYETAILKRFEAGAKEQTHTEETTVDGARVLRHLVPVYIAKSCLGCHGDPAGTVDISGHRREGYKDGELRGAISIVVPL
jgi:general secretion pathway protein A